MKKIIITVFALVLFAVSTLPINSFAALPQSINFQGYLSDPAGAPLTGTHSITFSLYNVVTGGIPLWEDTIDIAVTDGVFSVELGSNPVNVIDPLQFDTEMFLGIKVGLDAEMSPRQALTNAGFAMNAQAVDGYTRVQLDQSAHLSDINNPHQVTAQQLGALSQVELDTHTNSQDAHHSRFTAAEAQISALDAMGATDNANPLNHIRYGDAEAQGAMGAKANANPLNHDRYSDVEAVNAILTSDGVGSDLDAGFLEGYRANDIIAAASDTALSKALVSKPISSLPYTITTPGSYFITDNLSTSTGAGITVNTSNVTIDLMGYNLTGSGGAGDGILINDVQNVTVENGTVQSFGGFGVYAPSFAGISRGHRIINIRVINNGLTGISLHGSAHLVKDCSSSGNGNHGIEVVNGSGSTITGNSVSNNSLSGIDATNSVGLVIERNNVDSNGGPGILTRDSSMVFNNTVSSNNQDSSLVWGGIMAAGGSTIKGNHVSGNLLNNIHVFESGNSIENNFVSNSENGIIFSIDFSANPGSNFYANNRATGNTSNYTNILNRADQMADSSNVSF